MTRVPSVSRNMAANLIGQVVVAVVTIVFVPTYIRYLGMEAFGLIGLFITAQALMTLFDAGMSPTLNREMARYTSGALELQDLVDLIRSIEVIAGGIALLIVVGFAGAAGVISRALLNLDTLAPDTARMALAIMGVVVALRFVESIYRSALLGLQLQVWFNIANAGVNIVRHAGAAFVVAFVSPTIEAFFLWHLGVAVAGTLLLRTKLGSAHPRPDRPARFSPAALRSIRTFAAGMFGINLLAVMLTQVDKLLLVKLLPLAQFGAYSLAFTVASVLLVLSAAVNQAILPVMVEQISGDHPQALVATHDRTAQIIAAIVVPAAMVLIVFSNDVLMLWSGDPALVESTARLVALVAIGNMFNALMVLPYFAMVAHGWTRLSMLSNLVAVIVLVPALVVIVPIHGTVGAASVWIALNAGYVLVQAPLMHRRILRNGLWPWYRHGVVVPILVAGGVGAGLAWLRDGVVIPRFGLIASLGLAWGVLTLAVLMVLPVARARLAQWSRRGGD